MAQRPGYFKGLPSAYTNTDILKKYGFLSNTFNPFTYDPYGIGIQPSNIPVYKKQVGFKKAPTASRMDYGSFYPFQNTFLPGSYNPTNVGGSVQSNPTVSLPDFSPPKSATPSLSSGQLAQPSIGGRRSVGSLYAQAAENISKLGKPSPSVTAMAQPAIAYGTEQAVQRFINKPSLETGVSSGATYLFNKNPIYAGLNLLSGGWLDRQVQQGVSGLAVSAGLKKGPPAQDIKKANQQADIANRMGQYSAEYMRLYKEQQAAKNQASQNINAYRNQARNLAAFGPSARETAGLVATALGPAQEAAAAAQANLAARGTQMGLAPTSGVRLGGDVALQQGLAQAAGQVGTQIGQDMANRAFGMQENLLNIDAQQRNAAQQNAMAALGAATELPMALERLRMAQQQADYARDEQMYQRRFGEQQMLAQGLGAFAPELFDLYKRNRGQQEADTGMLEDAGMLPESDFGRVGGRATYRDAQGILHYFDATDEDRRLGRDLVNPTPFFNFGGKQVYQMPDGKFYDLRGEPVTFSKINGPAGQVFYQGADTTIYDAGGNVVFNPTAEYESQFTRPVSQSTQIALELMNPGVREGDYAMNKPPQLANQEFRFVNGRWMKR